MPVQLVNVGIGANVISTRSPSYEFSGKPAALERIDPHVIRHNPDLLIVSYGLNDARGGTPLPLFLEELETLIERVRANIQPLIVLLSPYYITGFDQYGPRQTIVSFRSAKGSFCGAKADTPLMIHLFLESI